MSNLEQAMKKMAAAEVPDEAEAEPTKEEFNALIAKLKEAEIFK